LGPFQDGVGLIENSRLIVFASIAWAIALIAGFISWRRFPWLLFAVLWFLLGHLLESTTLLLELYFEHRNYLPLLGFAITLAVLTYSVSGRLRRSAQIFSYLYVGVLGASLIGFTNLWGQPLKAAEFWANTRPSSARAAVHFANLSTGMPSEGINGLSSEISSVQRINHALQVLDGIRHLCPNCVELDIQRLAYSCFVRSEQDRISRYQELIFALRDNNYNVNITMVDGFALIGSLLSKGECDPLTFQMLDEAIDELIENGNWLPNSLRVRLLYQRATLSYAQSDFPQAEEWILKAETVDILAIPVIEFQLEFYREVKRYSDGIESIDRRLEWIKKSEREPFEEELLQRLSEQRRSLEEEIKKTHH
jgi:tetratricopeptide (TPR) repeat protein